MSQFYDPKQLHLGELVKFDRSSSRKVKGPRFDGVWRVKRRGPKNLTLESAKDDGQVFRVSPGLVERLTPVEKQFYHDNVFTVAKGMLPSETGHIVDGDDKPPVKKGRPSFKMTGRNRPRDDKPQAEQQTQQAAPASGLRRMSRRYTPRLGHCVTYDNAVGITLYPQIDCWVVVSSPDGEGDFYNIVPLGGWPAGLNHDGPTLTAFASELTYIDLDDDGDA